ALGLVEAAGEHRSDHRGIGPGFGHFLLLVFSHVARHWCVSCVSKPTSRQVDREFMTRSHTVKTNFTAAAHNHSDLTAATGRAFFHRFCRLSPRQVKPIPTGRPHGSCAYAKPCNFNADSSTNGRLGAAAGDLDSRGRRKR